MTAFGQPGAYTFQVPPDVAYLFVQLWGAGGGGASYDDVDSFVNYGGGAGAYAAGYIPVSGQASCTITVGQGGAGGTVSLNSGHPGTSGGATSVTCGTAGIIAAGGQGGGYRTSGPILAAGGSGGMATGAADVTAQMPGPSGQPGQGGAYPGLTLHFADGGNSPDGQGPGSPGFNGFAVLTPVLGP